MKGSLFKKLLGTYLIIVISAITLLSALLSLLYAGNVLQSKHRELTGAAVKINQLAAEYTNGEIGWESLDGGIDALGYATEAKIYLVRLNQAFLASKEAGEFAKEMKDSYLPEDLEKILDGQTVYRQNIYSDLFAMPVVFTGVPWKSGAEVQGAILMFAPVEGIVKNMMDINFAIWLTGLGFILISSVVIFFASRRISTPIKKVEQAASKLAAGEEPEDLEVVGEDEIAKLTRSFNLMKHQLENTEKMRRDFIANVSHDLRTPLTSINGFVEGMRDGLIKPENYGTYLDKIHHETGRLIRLTNEILQLAKLQAGGVGIAKERLSAASVIAEAEDGMRALLSSKEIRIEAKCKDSVTVFADRDKLLRILNNLLGNAVRYGRQGGTIKIAAEMKPAGTLFTIADDGIGISEADLPYIFEKFYRADKTRTSSEGGMGLGLNIVKNLVELHGGRIWAESRENVGTTMYMEFPKEP